MCENQAFDHSEMVWIDSGVAVIGSNHFYPEERPARRVEVSGFWVDRMPVTNRAFSKFVDETGYITLAERPLNPADYPGADPAQLQPGALVFHQPQGRVDPQNWHHWWRYVQGAHWRKPDGLTDALSALLDHPVVSISYEDAEAYAKWAQKSLPTEMEWEYAARGGLQDADYAWGNVFIPSGQHMANTWQGAFPYENLAEDGYPRTSPVGVFPPNGFGLYDMIGNVWEWTCDWYQNNGALVRGPSCCTSDMKSRQASLDPALPDIPIPRKVIKGGSHLCAPNYCQRYRPAARQPQMIDSATTHIGFRCVVRGHPPSLRPPPVSA